MPIMAKYAASHITRDVYESVRKALDWDNHPPAGALLHVVAFDDAGGLQSFDIWESQAQLDAYKADRLDAVLERLGLPEAKPELYDLAVAAAAPAITEFILPVLRSTAQGQFGASPEVRSFEAGV